MESITINGKPLQIVATSEFNRVYGGLEAALYVKDALIAIKKKPVDMYVFEMPDPEYLHIRCAGYCLNDNETLDEKTIVFKTESLPIKRFWFKIDDYGDKYVGTFLFPEDY